MGSGHRESVSTCLFRIEDALEFFASNFLHRPEGSCQFVGLPIAQHLLEVAWEAGLGLSKGWSGAFRARLDQARCWRVNRERQEVREANAQEIKAHCLQAAEMLTPEMGAEKGKGQNGIHT